LQHRLTAHLNLHGQGHADAVETIREETETLRTELDALRMSNREEERLERMKRTKVMLEMSAWVGRYDEEMMEKQAELDQWQVLLKHHL
jgi:hypothetical protein